MLPAWLLREIGETIGRLPRISLRTQTGGNLESRARLWWRCPRTERSWCRYRPISRRVGLASLLRSSLHSPPIRLRNPVPAQGASNAIILRARELPRVGVSGANKRQFRLFQQSHLAVEGLGCAPVIKSHPSATPFSRPRMTPL